MNKEIDMDITKSAENDDLERSQNTSLGDINDTFSLARQSESPTNYIPEKLEWYSTFGEETCGEPIMPQRVVMNFMPNDEDTDEISKKCSAFWQFVNEHPELNQFMVKAEPADYSQQSTTTATTASSPSLTSMMLEKQKPVGSAVKMLDFVENTGMINNLFTPKLPTRYCATALESRDYPDCTETNKFGSPKRSPKKAKNVCTCRNKCCDVCAEDVTINENPPGPSCPKAMALCDVLEKWDEQHTKSMDPPGHPPSLSHSIMQRKIIY